MPPLGPHRALLCLVIAALGTTGIAHAQVVITEIMHSPGGDDALWEWVEVLNTSNQPVNLHGWVFDDDDDPGVGAANISSAGGTRNTIVPAGGVAVLYPGDELDFMPERFNSAWGGGVTLIGVDGFTVLTGIDSIGLWPSHASYVADAIPMATMSPRRNFANAAAAIDYSSGFPTADTGHSIAWNGTGNVTSGANWLESQVGTLGAFASIETTIAGAQVNSTSDRGNPGLVRPGIPAAGLLFTEIMFAPSSPLVTVGFAEADFEWVELYNNTGAPIDFMQNPHVFDDDDGNNITAANITSGDLAPREIGILFNNEKISIDNMQSMWGAGFTYIPVSSWPSLNNSGGDTIAIWDSYSDYNSEPVVDSGRTHQNAVAAVTYNTVAAEGWPTVNNQSSIYLNNLSGDPNTGANWRRAGASGDTQSHPSSPIFALAVDHEGSDVGSPGFAPGSVVVNTNGDYNGNGAVDAADYVIWRKLIGTTSALPNDPEVGSIIDQDQYETWLENFGQPTAAGGGVGRNAAPEPTCFMLIAVSLMVLSTQRRCVFFSPPRAKRCDQLP